MEYRYNLACSKRVSKAWTSSAEDCYSIGCNCSKCNVYRIYFKNSMFKCKMKDAVIELVRLLGSPSESFKESL